MVTHAHLSLLPGWGGFLHPKDVSTFPPTTKLQPFTSTQCGGDCLLPSVRTPLAMLSRPLEEEMFQSCAGSVASHAARLRPPPPPAAPSSAAAAGLVLVVLTKAMAKSPFESGPLSQTCAADRVRASRGQASRRSKCRRARSPHLLHGRIVGVGRRLLVLHHPLGLPARRVLVDCDDGLVGVWSAASLRLRKKTQRERLHLLCSCASSAC